MNVIGCEPQNTMAAEEGFVAELAGARARGMADALALLGLPALFLDRKGKALHVNREAALLMGAALAIDEGRLTAADWQADSALQQAIALAQEGLNRPPVLIPDSGFAETGDCAIRVHALPIPGACDDEFQLLSCILLLERPGSEPVSAPARAAMRRIAGGSLDICPAH